MAHDKRQPTKRSANNESDNALRTVEQQSGTKAASADAKQEKRYKIITVVAVIVAVVALVFLCVTLASNCTSKTGTVIDDYSIEEDAGEEMQSLYKEYEDGELSASELMSTCYTLYNSDQISIDELYTYADMLGEEVDTDLIK